MEESLTIGLIGTGKIGSAVIAGYCSENGWRPQHVYISSRSADKAHALESKYPERITICDRNQDIVDQSDIIFIGLLPTIAEDLLPTLNFGDKIVISMMATIPYSQLLGLVQLPESNVVRTVPLPSASKRSGPILAFPKNELVEKLLRQVGTPVMVADESEITTLTGITALISCFYATCGNLQSWCTRNGVGETVSRDFIASFYDSLAKAGVESSESFFDMADEGATPGGLNEQVHRGLIASGSYSLMTNQLDGIYKRLTKKDPAPSGKVKQ